MKTIIMLFFALMCSGQIYSQTQSKSASTKESQAPASVYTIYSNTGIVTIQHGKEKLQLANGMKLTPNVIVNIPEHGELILVDESTRERFTISKSGSNSVSSLLSSSKKKLMAVSEFNYLKKNLKNHSNGGNYNGVITVDRSGKINILQCDSVATAE